MVGAAIEGVGTSVGTVAGVHALVKARIDVGSSTG